VKSHIGMLLNAAMKGDMTVRKALLWIWMALILMSGAAMDASAETGALHPHQPSTRACRPRCAFSYAVGRHPVIMYIPNRIFDLLDILRIRVRVGPGLSVGVRATEVADLYMGSHATIYAGLRGTRGKPEIPWPIGLEKNEGMELSVADVTDESRYAPCVDPLEFSLQAQALAVGVYVGVEIFEIFDFVTGLLLLDVQGDDF